MNTDGLTWTMILVLVRLGIHLNSVSGQHCRHK